MDRISDILSGSPFVVVVATLVPAAPGPEGGCRSVVPVRLCADRLDRHGGPDPEAVLPLQESGICAWQPGPWAHPTGRLMFKHIFPNCSGYHHHHLRPGHSQRDPFRDRPSPIWASSTCQELCRYQYRYADELRDNDSHDDISACYVLARQCYFALLLISFNLFGNGLRDAFNPSTRGVED